MNNYLEEMLEFYANNKKILNKISSLRNKQLDNIFDNKINVVNQTFFGKKGYQSDCINEFSITKLSMSIIEFLKQQHSNLKNINILIACDDLSNSLKKEYLQLIIDILNSIEAKIVIYSKKASVSTNLIEYSMHKIKNIDYCIYLHDFNYLDQLNLGISFFIQEQTINLAEKIAFIYQQYDLVNSWNVQYFKDDILEIDITKITNEYINEIRTFNYYQNGNKLIKIGIDVPKCQIRNMTQILGREDYSYQIVHKHVFDKKQFNLTLFKKNNFDYIISFNKNQTQLKIFSKTKNKLIYRYNEINFNYLIICYLYYINLNLPKQNPNINVKNIVYSYEFNQSMFEYLQQRHSLNIKDKKIFNLSKIFDIDNLLYLDDWNRFYLSNDRIMNYNLPMQSLILIDMLNYFQTQHIGINDILNEIKDKQQLIYSNYFKIKIDSKNLEAFITKLFVQRELGQISITEIYDLRNQNNDINSYIARFHFENNETLLVKFDWHTSELIFYVYEGMKTKQNIYLRLKSYFKSFTRNFKNNKFLNF
ncbi:Uncharacterised protein [Metamycoplasma cloacale]|uniref:Uncharacterized protein n=1 Tax=Metamycoplasma cloacale TaxID=92401 RepID=A0A2Z4LLL4_9BACT|nr:hypothetical protein [Metamycoplasma cloacale]AWX42661.1 hypothetical protein DK849_01015 [Metamycoplasma cloacale]VEU79533.1 Uncharacterised protein [Metamycoplasma cloacale]